MYVIKKRCGRCLHVLRDDGTCQNPKCVRYVKEDASATTDNAASNSGNAEATTANTETA